jgi:hypothetical protein
MFFEVPGCACARVPEMLQLPTCTPAVVPVNAPEASTSIDMPTPKLLSGLAHLPTTLSCETANAFSVV